MDFFIRNFRRSHILCPECGVSCVVDDVHDDLLCPCCGLVVDEQVLYHVQGDCGYGLCYCGFDLDG